ncbi:GntR family transcriptional regulator [Vibrio sp. 10N.286.49.B3]|uniref:MocR-like pyridoxine biosynthesis transcription factor PdxR n=1 Tax=Vibrio sp. 10N.286.49.B3 TaxID=1880855 RepID=UPI000C85AA5C|nr:PLP-dependent aminotransferase family protein [Vibrio sp. 10N.286.49.B3]PMH41821.1 GntR family transcriptional regulator [Vibrio sp. 10N.286.49.B3]
MKNQPLVHIEFSPHRSLQEQIREYLLNQIAQGMYNDNALPSCRKLASTLRVSRNTIVLVYDRLVDERILLAHQRSGYFTNPAKLQSLTAKNSFQHHLKMNNNEAKPAHFWSSRVQKPLDQQRNINKPTNWQQYPYPFLFGQPDHTIFPLNYWRECGRLSQRSNAIQDWISDSVDNDDPMLIKQLQTNVLTKRGIQAKPEQILVTIGTQNSLFLLAQLLSHPECKLGVEDPGYPDVRNIFAYHNAQVTPLNIDHQGLTISKELTQCDYVYTTPSHQVPTNITMSMNRRQQLLTAAEEHDLVIIEDDYDSEINLLSQPLPSLKSLDSNGRVIYIGSLSKSLSPGLRLGFMVADEAIITAARQLRRLMLRHPPANNQRTCALFISMGYYNTYLSKLRKHCIDKWTLVRKALDRHLPTCITNDNMGGSSFWLRLPDTISCQQLVIKAEQVGILVEPGDVHFYDPSSDNEQYIRLGFSAIDINMIEPGIARLAEVIEQMVMAEKPQQVTSSLA